MWDFLKKAGQQILQAGVAFADNRAFILSLLQGSEASAHQRLRERMQALDDSGYNAFTYTLAAMIGQAARHLQEVRSSGGLGAWGNSFEDRMAQAVAQFNSGDHSLSNGAIQQAEQMLAGLQIVKQYAEVYRAESRNAAPAPAIAAAPPSPRPAQPDAEEIERMFAQVAETGVMPDGLLDKLQQIDDPELMERLTEKLQAMGAEEIGSGPLLNIKDYYVAGTEPYTILWPLSSAIPLPIPFEKLDRETQFHVLWGETSRRLTEGSSLRNEGKLEEAESAFRECLERADQLEVPILKAQGYEGLLSIAERRGDRKAAERYLKLVQQEQQRQAARKP